MAMQTSTTRLPLENGAMMKKEEKKMETMKTQRSGQQSEEDKGLSRWTDVL